MSAAHNHLIEIYQQLRDCFSDHTIISVVPAAGNPPDRYQAIYHMKGLTKPGSGDVVEAFDHVVELTIPFGFPHFPPSCKPKSSIFHPDFDPAAVCLGDFWHQDRRIADLILYIGQMINGEYYSRTNAFNEEACLWYVSQADSFPLAEIEWLKKEPIANHAAHDTVPVVDTLDENDLSTNFDFLSMEEQAADEGPPSNAPLPAGEPAVTHDLNQLNFLDSHKKYFALCESIKEGDTANLPEEVQKLFRKAEEVVQRAGEWFQESRRMEKRGDVAGAVGALVKIGEYVEDFPDLELHLERLRQKDFDRGSAPESPIPEIEEISGPVKSPLPKRRMSTATKGSPAVRSRRWSKKIAVVLLGGIGTACIAGSGIFYWRALGELKAADAALSQCITLFEKDRFQEARRFCEEAGTASEGISFILENKVEQLRAQIDRILQSERMVKGLEGLILVDGRYLAQNDVETMKVYGQLHAEAEDFFAKEEWQPAADRFAQILALPDISRLISADVATDVTKKHELARFRQVYDAGMQSLANGKWQESVAELREAAGLFDLLPEDDRLQYAASLESALTKGGFEQSREQGDLFFADSKWQEAIAAYDLALSTAGSEVLPAESLENALQNMKRAQLYDLIDQGIKAFGAGAWDEAIGDYRRAEEFLANHQAHLNVTDADKLIKKLSRIILQALIVRDRQNAAGHLGKNELSTSRNIYLQSIDRIEKSSFSGENEFMAAKKEFAKAVRELDEKIFIAEKSKYLESEYRALFTDNYPTAVVGNLINPIISFTKDSGDKAIFRMQCTETGGGRPLTLVMYYAFDRKNGQWTLYTEPE